MRKLVRSTPLKTMGRNTQVGFNPQANDQRLRNWTNRLNNLGTSATSKIYLGQLGALINYYNRAALDNTKPINWSEWSSRIITEGLVDTVKQNYEAQAKQEYELDKIFTDVFSRDSKSIDEINSQMAFHTAIWLENYFGYATFLNDLSTVSSHYDYNPVEWTDMHQGLQPTIEALVETHCFNLGARDDVNLWGFMVKQFAWGKKVFTYYRHPSDDFKDGKATKNAMGR